MSDKGAIRCPLRAEQLPDGSEGNEGGFFILLRLFDPGGSRVQGPSHSEEIVGSIPFSFTKQVNGLRDEAGHYWAFASSTDNVTQETRLAVPQGSLWPKHRVGTRSILYFGSRGQVNSLLPRRERCRANRGKVRICPTEHRTGCRTFWYGRARRPDLIPHVTTL